MTQESEIVIPEPSFSQGVGKQLICWKELGITVEISRIKDDSHCEIMVFHENGNGKEVLQQSTSVNLISDIFLRLSKRLAEKAKPLTEKNWKTILEHVSYYSIKASREGNPVVMLEDEKYGKTRPDFLLFPLCIKDAPNIIYTDRGGVKTTFALLADLILSLPWWNNPLGLYVPQDAKHTVLFLDWESNEQIIGWQKACLRRGMKVPDFPVPYRRCARPLADDLPQIQAKIDQTKADVIIIDSLGMAVGDDLNLTKPAFSFFAALRQLPVTSLILAHTTKDKDNKYKTVYGNAYYEAEARSIWEANKQQEIGSKELILTLHHRKSAPFMGLHDPLAFDFTFEDNETLVSTGEASQDKRQGDRTTSIDAVFSVISDSDKPVTQADVFNKLNKEISMNTIYVCFTRLMGTDKKHPKPRIKKNEAGYIVNE